MDNTENKLLPALPTHGLGPSARIGAWTDRFVAAPAALTCTAHAEPGRKPERLGEEVRGWGKRVVSVEEIAALLKRGGG